MTFQKHLATTLICAALSLGTAWAAPDQRPDQRDDHRSDQRPPQQHRTDRDEMGGAMRGGMPGMRPEQHWKDDRGRTRTDHDRYWQPQYRGFVAQDRVFQSLRGHGYARFNGSPYWHQGRYVVKSYDRRGRAVFIEVNPYTGAYVGVVRF